MQHEDKNEYLRSNNYFLEADGLTMHFPAASDNLGRTVSWIHGADDVSFRVPKGKTLGRRRRKRLRQVYRGQDAAGYLSPDLRPHLL